MNSKTISNFVLPLIIFPLILGLGCKYMYAEHIAAGISADIQALCPSHSPKTTPPPFILASSKSYLRSYTFISSIDHGICHLIAFFHLLLDSPFHAPRKFTSYLLGTGLPFVFVPLIEAYRFRGKQHWLLRYPTFWLMLAQVVTLGIMSTVYWPLLIISRAASSSDEEKDRRTKKTPSKKTTPGTEKIAELVGPTQGEALIFGIAIGFIVPSVAMTLYNDPITTWAWQFYPIYVALARAVYVSLRTPSNLQSQNITRTLYTTTFLIVSLTHILLTWPLLRHSDWKLQLFDLLVPSIATTGAHPSRHAHNFLKWDYALGCGSILVGLLWSARSFGQVVMMILWYAVAIPVVGAGGAIMGVLAWRDL